MVSHIRKRVLIAFAMVAIVAFANMVYWRWFHADKIRAGEFREETYSLVPDKVLTEKEVPLLIKLNQEFSMLGSHVSNSIVSIRTAGVADVKTFNRTEGVVTQKMAVHGLGSGVIISKEGHIITNQHVINGKQAVRVRLANGRDYPVYLVGEDKLLDIAVLKIDSDEHFTPLPLGDSDGVRPGQIVMAFGNPYGLGASMTQGIVSGRDRRIEASGGVDWIQTDATIHPGNSGGPLINIYGQVIGINTALDAVSTSTNTAGLGFAIPSNLVKEAFQQICEYGHPMRGYHGAEFIDNTDDLSNYLKNPVREGVFVNSIQPGSPAHAAGLKRGDLVMKLSGDKVKNSLDILRKIEKFNIGDIVVFAVIRNTKEINVSMKMADYQDGTVIPYPSLELLHNMGVTVREFNLNELSRGAYGLLVTKVNANSKAADIFREGDLIYSGDSKPFNSLAELDEVLMKGKAVLGVARQTDRFNVNVNLNL